MEKTIYKISEIGEVVGGGTPSTSNAEFWGGNIPWISPKDLTGYTSMYISHGENFLTSKGLKSGTRLLPKNTVLFSSRAPIGYVAIASNPICTNQGFKSVICKKGIVIPQFLYYYIKANLNYIKLFGTGATFPEISGAAMKKIKVALPHLPIQQKIASILSTYDTLIENNTKRIRLLEQMAENLYKEWFVRFRFPGHENVEMENGLPRGWKIERLGSFLKFERGVGYGSKDIENGDYTLLSMNNIKPFGGFISDYSRPFSGKFKEFQLLKEHDLIMSITDMTQDRRIIGYVGIVPPGPANRVICTHLIKISSSLYGNFFLNGLFNYSGLSRVIAERATGTNVLGMTADILRKVKCILPESSLIERYESIAHRLFTEKFKFEEQNNLLTRQRDLLLPRLMSGRLEVMVR